MANKISVAPLQRMINRWERIIADMRSRIEQGDSSLDRLCINSFEELGRIGQSAPSPFYDQNGKLVVSVNGREVPAVDFLRQIYEELINDFRDQMDYQ